MFTTQFWKATVERCVKTVAQAVLAIVAVDQFDWMSANWSQIAAVAISAGVLSILTSIASDGIGPKGSPSIVD